MSAPQTGSFPPCINLIIDNRLLSHKKRPLNLGKHSLSPWSTMFLVAVAFVWPLYLLTSRWVGKCRLCLTCLSLPPAALFHFSLPHLVFSIRPDLDIGVQQECSIAFSPAAILRWSGVMNCMAWGNLSLPHEPFLRTPRHLKTYWIMKSKGSGARC